MNDLEKKIIDAAKKYAIRDGYHDELYKDEQAFEAGAKWALSQDSTIEKVKELRDEIKETFYRLEKALKLIP